MTVLARNIRDRKTIDQYVHQVVNNDDQPAGSPFRRVRVVSRRLAFRPRPAARPWPVLYPRNVAREVPAIDHEVRSADHRERRRVERNKEKRNKVKNAVHERRERAPSLLACHPLTLQQVVTYPVSH